MKQTGLLSRGAEQHSRGHMFGVGGIGGCAMICRTTSAASRLPPPLPPPAPPPALPPLVCSEHPHTLLPLPGRWFLHFLWEALVYLSQLSQGPQGNKTYTYSALLTTHPSHPAGWPGCPISSLSQGPFWEAGTLELRSSILVPQCQPRA